MYRQELPRQACNVSRFHQSFDSIKIVPVAQVATAIITDSGATFVLVVDEALIVGNTMTHSLINPNQIRAYGISVSDDPCNKSPDFGISHESCFNPFNLQGSTVFFESFVPSDEHVNTYQHIKLTSNEEWDPSEVQMKTACGSVRARLIQQLKQQTWTHLLDRETDSLLASISEAMCHSLFG
eukprot:CCRYP_006553-RA/>CCRYP_006553-RA protein AED:0.41 eAED:0.40 QI:0/0/0/1/0/0/2/0/181